MICQSGIVYVFGGYSDDKDCCTASVEAYDPKKGYCLWIGDLPDYNITNTSGINNLACCLTADDDCIVICGAYPQHNASVKKEVLKWCHTVQIFSCAKKKTTHSMTLARMSIKPVYAVVHVHGGKLIVFANEYTACCSVQDVKDGKPENVLYRDKYIVPNYRCGATISSDGERVVLLGGEPRSSSPQHFVYQAKVQDIFGDAGSGWEKLGTHWPMGKCWLFGFDAGKVNLK